jgi:hypothetical protein
LSSRSERPDRDQISDEDEIRVANLRIQREQFVERHRVAIRDCGQRVAPDHDVVVAVGLDADGSRDREDVTDDHHGVGHSEPVDIPPGAILNFKDPDDIALALMWRR